MITLAARPTDVGTGSLSITTTAGQTSFSVFAVGSGEFRVGHAHREFLRLHPWHKYGYRYAFGIRAGGTERNRRQLHFRSKCEYPIDCFGGTTRCRRGTLAQIQPLAGGQTAVVTLTVGDPNLGTVAPSSVTFTGGIECMSPPSSPPAPQW